MCECERVYRVSVCVCVKVCMCVYVIVVVVVVVTVPAFLYSGGKNLNKSLLSIRGSTLLLLCGEINII